MMQPDAIIHVRFLTPAEGGRSKSITGSSYGCPLFIDGRGFDCRIMLDELQLDLGREYDLPIKFLNRSLAMPFLAQGKAISLWEGKEIATGTITELPSTGASM